ncbi:MAG: hypothetical protein ACR2RE_29300, partial [Geminicoccaceae bacterium]
TIISGISTASQFDNIVTLTKRLSATYRFIQERDHRGETMMLRDDLGREWPEGFAPDERIVQTYEEAPWRWLTLAGLAFLRGATLDEGSSLDTAGPWYLFSLAVLAIFVGDWTLRVRRSRQRHQQKLDDPGPLMQVLRDYGVDELGGFYLYLPVPERPEDGEARAWFRVLRAKGLVI